MLQIISGKLKNRKIELPKNAEKDLRPSLAKIRDAIFNIIGSRYDLTTLMAIDLFAGTGALGLEGLSRGLQHVTFIERNHQAVQILKNNLKLFGLQQQSTVYQTDAIQWLTRQKWSQNQSLLFLIDPPYQSDLLQQIIQILTTQANMLPESLLIIEMPKTIDLIYPSGVQIIQQKKYNRTKIDFLKIHFF